MSQTNNTAAAEDFFSVDAESDMQEYLQHMKRPKEEIEMPDIDMPGLDDDEEDKPNAGEHSPDDEENLRHLDYSKEQEWWAELILTQIDKAFAWLFSMLTNQESSRYRVRTGKAAPDDHEVVLMAAIINKYQLRFSLEFALGSAILMKYGMVYSAQVVPDMKRKKAEEDKKEQMRNAA